MRSLRTCDIFSAVRLMNKIGVREEFREVAKQAEESKGKKARFDAGFDLLFGILDKATEQNSEEEVYKFIADIFECEWEAVRDMDPIELFDELEKVADWEKWGNFFKRVAGLMKKK